MIDILNSGAINQNPITVNTLSYLTFADPNQPMNSVYDAVAKQLITSSISKTDINTISPGVMVGEFPGTASIPFVLKEPIGTGDFTLEIWLRVPATSSSLTMLAISNMMNQSSGTQPRISIGFGSGTLYTPTRYGTNNVVPGTIQFDTWTHYSIIRKDGVAYVFINGLRVNQFAYTGNNDQPNFRLGSYVGGTLRYFKGQIAEAAVSAEARYDVSGFTPNYPLFNI